MLVPIRTRVGLCQHNEQNNRLHQLSIDIIHSSNCCSLPNGPLCVRTKLYNSIQPLLLLAKEQGVLKHLPIFCYISHKQSGFPFFSRALQLFPIPSAILHFLNEFVIQCKRFSRPCFIWFSQVFIFFFLFLFVVVNYWVFSSFSCGQTTTALENITWRSWKKEYLKF